MNLRYPEFWNKGGLFSIVLIPISWIYLLLAKLRKIFAKPIRFDSRTICVGNASVGGTGKTQIVIWLANILKQNNIEFIIVTNGYKTKVSNTRVVKENDVAEEVGDESLLLARHGKVVISKNPKYLDLSIFKNKPEVIIFDDRMQNPNFIKDFTILVVDSGRGVGNGRLIPAGPMREDINSALARSDAMIMMGNGTHKNYLTQKAAKSKTYNFGANMSLANKLDKAKNYYAFASIGDPKRFYSLLKSYGVNVEQSKSFSDHYLYSEKDIEELIGEVKNKNLQLITTSKDYVKISKEQQKYIICMDVELIINNDKKLLELINEKIKIFG